MPSHAYHTKYCDCEDCCLSEIDKRYRRQWKRENRKDKLCWAGIVSLVMLLDTVPLIVLFPEHWIVMSLFSLLLFVVLISGGFLLIEYE